MQIILKCCRAMTGALRPNAKPVVFLAVWLLHFSIPLLASGYIGLSISNNRGLLLVPGVLSEHALEGGWGTNVFDWFLLRLQCRQLMIDFQPTTPPAIPYNKSMTDPEKAIS